MIPIEIKGFKHELFSMCMLCIIGTFDIPFIFYLIVSIFLGMYLSAGFLGTLEISKKEAVYQFCQNFKNKILTILYKSSQNELRYRINIHKSKRLK